MRVIDVFKLLNPLFLFKLLILKPNHYKYMIYRGIRRRGILLFKPNYLKLQELKKRGSCGDCCCCPDCKWLLPNKKCRLYYTKYFPVGCKYSPFDEKDKAPEIRNKCNFHWVNNTNN